ncbi:hypothetical protein ABT236_32290 [Streptomyces sp. NPDC001523]|uniref:hypothetical protein n=1 Tax=Streptomyces sp. NPDC001523 TaxID=3154383 RepID=UPI00331BAE75
MTPIDTQSTVEWLTLLTVILQFVTVVLTMMMTTRAAHRHARSAETPPASPETGSGPTLRAPAPAPTHENAQTGPGSPALTAPEAQ